LLAGGKAHSAYRRNSIELALGEFGGVAADNRQTACTDFLGISRPIREELRKQAPVHIQKKIYIFDVPEV
jgi:hypothetical protein